MVAKLGGNVDEIVVSIGLRGRGFFSFLKELVRVMIKLYENESCRLGIWTVP